jgi:hypothetical protein
MAVLRQAITPAHVAAAHAGVTCSTGKSPRIAGSFV